MLISESQHLLLNPSVIKYDAPIIFIHEFTRDSKLCSLHFKFLYYKHSQYGGCTNLRLCFGFRNISILPNSLKIQQSIGDFLDYTMEPNVAVRYENIDNRIHLLKNSVLSHSRINDNLVLSTYRFSMDWRVRKLTRKKFFYIWRITDFDLLNSQLGLLFAIAPTQVANLFLTSYILTNKSQIILQLLCTKNSTIKNYRIIQYHSLKLIV